jgi:hypothetical protein
MDNTLLIFGVMVVLCCLCVVGLIIWDYSRDDSFLFGEDGLFGSNDDSPTSSLPSSGSDSSDSGRPRRSGSDPPTYNPYIVDGGSFITNTTMTRDDCSATDNEGLGLYCTDKVLLAPRNCGNGVATCSESVVERGQGKDCNVVFPGNLLDNETTVCGNDDAISPCPNWAITQIGEIMKSESGWNVTPAEKNEVNNNFLFVGDENGYKCTNKMVYCTRLRRYPSPDYFSCIIANTPEENRRIYEEDYRRLVETQEALESSAASDASEEYQAYLDSGSTVSPPHMLPINSCPSGQVRYTSGREADAPVPCIPPRCYIKDGLYYAADPDAECRACRIASVPILSPLNVRNEDGITVRRTDPNVCSIDDGQGRFCCDADHATKWLDPDDNEVKYVCGSDVCGDQWNPDAGKTRANKWASTGCKPVDFDTDVYCDLNDNLEEGLEVIDLYDQGIQLGSCEDPNALEIHCNNGYLFEGWVGVGRSAGPQDLGAFCNVEIPGNLSGQTEKLRYFNDERTKGKLALDLYANHGGGWMTRRSFNFSAALAAGKWLSAQVLSRDGVDREDAHAIALHMGGPNYPAGTPQDNNPAEIFVKSRNGERCTNKEVKCVGTLANGEYAGQDCSVPYNGSMDTWTAFNWCLTVDGNDPAVGCYVGVGDKVTR